MNNSKLRLVISLLIAVGFSACAPPSTNDSGNSTPSSSSTASGDDTLKLLYWQAPTILNPHLATGFKDLDAARIAYEPLASYDKNDQLVPFLAAEIPSIENGGVAPDGKSVIWKLKQNVQWSDGKPFTAEDVVFTYEFAMNPQVAAASQEYFSTIETVEAVDPHTVKITFKTPTPGWSIPFTGQNGLILPRHIFEPYNGANVREAPANQKPIGTGPYQVTEFKPGDIVIYEKNPTYWDQTPYFQRVELKGGGDAASAARAVLQTGDADYGYNLQVEANILQQLEAGGQGKVVGNFGSEVERILFNLTDPNRETTEGERSSIEFPHPFFTDQKVRQAIDLAIDRETIANQLYGKAGRPIAQLLVAPQVYKSDQISFGFDLEKAAKLLDEAGWKDTNGNNIRDKNGVEMTVVFQTSVNPVRQKTQEIIKQSLTQIGVQVELKSIDASVFFSGDPANPETLNRFYADLQEFATGNDNPDPGPYMKWWICDEIAQKSNNWQKNNYARYCNPDYDKLWQQANQEMNLEKRAELFRRMDELLRSEVILIPIIHRAKANGVSNRLVNVDPSPWDANTWDIKNWKRPD
ncbi:MAG: peptide ABC transporter substrate-binding protein [Oscillatoriales cyanobacterium RM2_1_1]|nr:peptide ABC transporter substrate-binding protein [Oscillatoriales cyanobacterium RM2_1_1]